MPLAPHENPVVPRSPGMAPSQRNRRNRPRQDERPCVQRREAPDVYARHGLYHACPDCHLPPRGTPTVRDDSARHQDSGRSGRGGKRRFDDDEPYSQKRSRHRVAMPSVETFDITDGLPEGDRWSTWDQPAAGQRGPQPYPPWLVTELAAVDTELGILKTGKEADVFLLRRGAARQFARRLLAGEAVPSGPGTGCSIGTTATWRAAGSASRASEPGHGPAHRVRAGGDRRAVGHRRVHGAGPAA